MVDDSALVARIIRAYQAAVAETRPTSSFWDHAIADKRAEVHDALVRGNLTQVQSMLRNPAANDLFYGFENICRSLPVNDSNRGVLVTQALDRLRTLGAALGCGRQPNPEPSQRVTWPDSDVLVDAIAASMGVDLRFPNFFPGEVGIQTRRGLINFRATQAVYQAHLLTQCTHRLDSIVEIGGGLGRTAFFAHAMGRTRYTIVDIPLTAVAQAYFLGRALGEHAVVLFGEVGEGIRLVPPSEFFNAGEPFDLALNVDSLTELDREVATKYCQAIYERGRAFLSINHEANPFTVAEVALASGLQRSKREPYWLRAGYVQEWFL